MKFKLIIIFSLILNIGYSQRVLTSLQATMDSLPRINSTGLPLGSPINGWITPKLATLDASGNLNTGTTVNGIYTIKNTNNSYVVPQTGTMLHLVSDNVVNGRISNDTYNNVSFVGSNYQGRRARGTSVVPTGALVDDILVTLAGDAYGTTGYHNISLGSLTLRASQTITDVNGGTYWAFSTSANNTTSNLERVRIDNTGNIGIGTITPTSTLHTIGSVAKSIRTSTAQAITVLATDYTVIYSSLTLAPTFTLPAANSCSGREYVLVNNSVTAGITSTYTNYLGVGVTTMAAQTAIKVQSDGTVWRRVQ